MIDFSGILSLTVIQFHEPGYKLGPVLIVDRFYLAVVPFTNLVKFQRFRSLVTLYDQKR